jgi:transcriptional regulator with XRE-family HTH domain
MKTPAERGPIGAWAYTARTAVELTVEEVADQLRARGHAVHPATLRGIEGGTKKPGRALLAGLSEIYGVHPPRREEPAPLEGVPELVAMTERAAQALERQAFAVEGLLAMLSGATAVEVRPEAAREVAEAEDRLAASRADESKPQPHVRRRAEA